MSSAIPQIPPLDDPRWDGLLGRAARSRAATCSPQATRAISLLVPCAPHGSATSRHEGAVSAISAPSPGFLPTTLSGDGSGDVASGLEAEGPLMVLVVLCVHSNGLKISLGLYGARVVPWQTRSRENELRSMVSSARKFRHPRPLDSLTNSVAA
jgi:hypothetical protein